MDVTASRRYPRSRFNRAKHETNGGAGILSRNTVGTLFHTRGDGGGFLIYMEFPLSSILFEVAEIRETIDKFEIHK
jgi:hypothetical protein